MSCDRETGLGKVSDGELARAILHGVDRDGHLALGRSTSCGEMADEALTTVISYLRTLPPVTKETGPSPRAAGSFSPKGERQGAQIERSTPKPMYVQRGNVAGHSAGTSHSALHRMPVLLESVHNALAQSASPAQAPPARPVPRAPGTQNTFAPVESFEWQ